MFANALKKKLMMQAAVIAAPLLLAGCSSVPDAINPVEWYNSSVEYFTEDEPETASSEEVKSETGEASEMAAPAQKQVGSGFVAAKAPDRQYAQPVMRQGDVVNPLGDTMVASQPPAPAAAPITPVTTSQMADASTPSLSPQDQVAPVIISSQSAVVGSPEPSQQQVLRPMSVGEVFAQNLSQTRPLDMAGMQGGMRMMDPGMMQFETVVVSGNGVSHQTPSYMPNQYASLSQTVQTDVRDTYSSAMAIEPNVVKQGMAQSMRNFNPSMFTGSFQVATIQFGIGSASLTDEDVRILREVINIHRQQGGVIRILGHASSRTRDMTPEQHLNVNQKVSLQRADMVASELLKLGMPGDNLFVGGVSDSQPLYQEVMPSGEAGNRRTEIFVDY